MRRKLRIGPTFRTPAGLLDQYQLHVKLSRRYGTAPLSACWQPPEQTLHGGVAGIAMALAVFAADHGLTVAVADSQQRVVLSRA